jgi:hypothetical protein
MKNYQSIADLEADLDLARSNPADDSIVDNMLIKYKASSEELKKQIKKLLCDKMLEDNPMYLFEKLSKENPTKVIYCNSQQDPFYTI